MTEGNMRRFGLKLLFATALTVLLVASIRQQFNSTIHKQLARQRASADTSDSNGGEGHEDHESSESSYANDDRVERIDATMEEFSENTKDLVVNSVGASTDELEKNNTRSREAIDDANGSVQDEEAVGGSIFKSTLNSADEEKDGDSEIAISPSLSSHESENSPETTKDNDEDVPAYDDDDPSDPNWRATKFADSLYDDEDDGAGDGADDETDNEVDDGAGDKADDVGNETSDENDEENNYSEDDSPYTGTKDKNIDDNIEQPQPDFKKNDNTDNTKSSLFSWLQLTKYVSLGNNPRDDDNDANEAYYKDDNTFKNKQENVATPQSSNINVNVSTLTEQELNHNGNQEKKGNAQIQSWSGYSRSNINETVKHIFREHENESQNILQNTNSNELPFSVNGIDEANYDDLDDFIQKNVHTRKDESEEESRIEKLVIDNYLPDTSKGTSNGTSDDTINNKISSLEVANPEVQGGLTMPHLWSKGNEAVQLIPSIANKQYGSYNMYRTQQNQQQTQSLRYQQQQSPIIQQLPHQQQQSPIIEQLPQQQQQVPIIQQLPQQQQQATIIQQLPQQQQMFLKALLPPRMLDAILTQNLEPPYRSQSPIKMQYFIHQNIPPIDQAFDPMANSEKKYTANGQTQISASQTLRQNGPILSPMRGLKYEEILRPGDVRTDTNGSDTGYEDYDNDDKFYENSDNKLKADDNNFYKDEASEQDNIYTPIPETAVYDNPRPLSEEQFALFRTRPYGTNFEPANSLSRSDVGVIKYSVNSGDIGTAGSSQQQISSRGVGNEDETLSCPRDVILSKLSQPVTALVAFSDDGTLWVRKILEQLTGIETDSIYNIMAQLKMGNVASVYQMGRKIAIESHIASVKNFERAIVIIKNPFSVDVQHKTFRPSSVDWQKGILWNQTYSTWLTSSLPLHVMTYEDLVERPLTELMKLTDFLSSAEMTISYKCAMKVALDPPDMIDDIRQIAGIYHDDRRRISQNIDSLIQVVLTTHPHIASRLNSYKVVSGTQESQSF